MWSTYNKLIYLGTEYIAGKRNIVVWNLFQLIPCVFHVLAILLPGSCQVIIALQTKCADRYCSITFCTRWVLGGSCWYIQVRVYMADKIFNAFPSKCIYLCSNPTAICLSHLPLVPHICVRSALVQIMACRPIGAKPFSEPMLEYC